MPRSGRAPWSKYRSGLWHRIKDKSVLWQSSEGTMRTSAQAKGRLALTHRITLIPGDGTGPEIVDATRRAIEATGVAIQWDVHDIGLPALQKLGDAFPKSALDSIRRNKVGLKGP